jgi:hypothetical protein
MRQETSNRTNRRRGFGGLAVAALAAGVALLSAGPAQARNDFQNGFEDQLGRIAAHGAVSLGLHVLAGGGYYGPPPPFRYYPPGYAYGYAYRYPVRHVVRHKYAHRHQHGWNCGHDDDRWDDDDDGRGRGRGHRYHRWDDDDD